MTVSVLILSAALQTTVSAGAELPPMPEDLSAVPVAEFQRKPQYSWKESLKAKKLTKGCEPTRKLNDGEYYFVNVLMLSDGEGSLIQVTPISINCPPLEEYVASYFAEQGKNNMLATADGKPAWRRSILKFYW